MPKLYTIFILVGATGILGLKISYSDPSKCKENQYFQFSSLQCKDCETNLNRSRDGLSCVCNNGYRFIRNDGGPNVECTACNPLEVASLDGWSCIKCRQDSDYDYATRTCKTCDSGSQAFDRQQNGAFFSDKRLRCKTCTNDTQPNALQGKCGRCDQNVIRVTDSLPAAISCKCPVADTRAPGSTSTINVVSTGGMCFSTATTTLISDTFPSMFTVSFPQKSVESVFFKQNLRAAQAVCKNNKNFTACQLLGNLCVLYMYNEDNYQNTRISDTDACKEFLLISQDSSVRNFVSRLADWPAFMPWLYYKADTAIEALDKSDITTVYNKGQSFRFALAVHTANGTFLGIRNDTLNLQLCADKPSKMNAAYSFSTSYSISCSISVSNLLNSKTLFYDLYFFTSETELYAVPLLVENYKSGSTYVNQGNDRSKWKLTRRFFLVDNLSGRTQLDRAPSLLRYAEKIELKFRLRNTNGQIYPPYMKIKYGSVEASKSSVKVSFDVTYEMDTATITKNVEVCMYVTFLIRCCLSF